MVPAPRVEAEAIMEEAMLLVTPILATPVVEAVGLLISEWEEQPFQIVKLLPVPEVAVPEIHVPAVAYVVDMVVA
jgi:hypothetical protein